jgi:hypothetical protein
LCLRAFVIEFSCFGSGLSGLGILNSIDSIIGKKELLWLNLKGMRLPS